MEQDIGKVYKFKINKLEEENSKLQENNEEIKEKFLRNIEETEKLKKQLQSNIRVFNKTIDEQNKKIKELEEKNKKNLIEIICYQEELENSIPVSLVEEKIEEYFEDEEWLVEHDLRALCDDEKECREYYTNKKIALKDIKKAILDKLNKLLKNY